MKKQFYFLSGLPRSGSTVLSAIINQNPSVYVTPTSPMLDLLIENQNTWHKTPSVIANPFPEQLTNITKAMINSCWEHRPESIIIDKNRGWCKNMPASSILFDEDIKMIATVRDLPSIMASWLTLLKNNPNSFMIDVLRNKGLNPTDENMLMEMWYNMVMDCMEGIQFAKRDAADRILFIDYDDLVKNPNETLDLITNFLNLPNHVYNFNQIENTHIDDDLTAWGLSGMHKIRNKLEKNSRPPIEVLGKKLYDKFVELEQNYSL